MAQRNLLLDLVSEGAMGSSVQPSGAQTAAERVRTRASLHIARALEEERAYSEHIRPLQQVLCLLWLHIHASAIYTFH